MKVKHLRQALHLCVDLLLDAVEQDRAEGQGLPPKKPARAIRRVIDKPRPKPNLTPEQEERLSRIMARAG